MSEPIGEGLGPDLTLARHYLQVGRPDQALEALTRLGEAAAMDAGAWEVRGRALILLGRHEEAVGALERGLALEADDADLLYLLAHAEMRLGRPPEAERHLLDALRLAPSSAALLLAYAELVARGGQFDKARALLQRAEESDPADEGLARVRALLATLEGRDRQAVAETRAWVADSPDDAAAHYAVAATLATVGRSDAGYRHARQAATLDPRVVEGDEEWFREQRLMSHWAMVPLRPVQRFGPAVVWGAAVAILLGLRFAGLDAAAAVFAVTYLAFVVYSWTAPPILRRVLRRRQR